MPKHNLYHRIDKKHDEYTLVFGRRIFKTIRKILYKNNVKYFSKEILNYLTPQSIALWIMDDGSHCVNKRNGKIISHSFHLYTYTDIEETNNIIEYFYEKYNIRLYKIKQEPKCGIRYYLKCKTREFRKLSNLVNPFILQSMKYKILID